MAANQCAAASRSISSIGIGTCTVTQPIRRSKRLCSTFLSIKAIGNFSVGPNRTVTFRRFGSIPRSCRKRLAPISHSRGRDVARRRWDISWPRRDELQRLILPVKVWKLSSTRPVNHPQRRLAALSALTKEWPAFRRSLGKRSAAPVEEFFDALGHPFWNRHYTLTADVSPESMALVGESRVADILAEAGRCLAEKREACRAFNQPAARDLGHAFVQQRGAPPRMPTNR